MPSLDSVGYQGFCETNLEQINFPSLLEISERSFSYNKTQTIILPNLKKLNGCYCFHNASNLKIFIALKLKNISSLSFSGCYELITVVATFAHVQNNAFCYCKNLKVVSVIDGNYQCDWYGKCESCPKCKGIWQQCLKRGINYFKSQDLQNIIKI